MDVDKKSMVKIRISRENIGLFLLISSYGFWLPGILLILFSYEDEEMVGFKVKSENLLSTLSLLQSMGATFAVFLVGFFGIGVPIVKLFVGLLAWKLDSPYPKSALAKVSKWAILDALACCIIMAYFMGNLERPWAYVGPGFNLFVLYCLLSTYAATLIDRPFEISRRPSVQSLATPAVSLVALTCSLVFTLAAFFEPLYSLELGKKVTLSFMTAISRLTTHSSISDGRPAALLLIFVVMLPILETLGMMYLLFFPQDNKAVRWALQVVPEFCLYEVFTVTLPVMIFFVNGVGELDFQLIVPTFLLFAAASACKILARYALPQYLARSIGRKASSQSSLQSSKDPVSCPTVIIVSSSKGPLYV